MGVASASNILSSSAILHSKTRLGNELGHVQTAHVHAKDLVYRSPTSPALTGLLVGEHLNQTIGLSYALARLLACSGKVHLVYSTFSFFSCASVLPTMAISGSVYTTPGMTS